MNLLRSSIAMVLLSLSAATGRGAEKSASLELPDGVELTKLISDRLQKGNPEEKEAALNFARELKPLALMPELIRAIDDSTLLPRHGDTGWGFVGHQAATVVGEMAQQIDGLDMKERGRDKYSFFSDASEDGAKLKELGRLAVVRKNWERWWNGRAWRTKPSAAVAK